MKYFSNIAATTVLAVLLLVDGANGFAGSTNKHHHPAKNTPPSPPPVCDDSRNTAVEVSRGAFLTSAASALWLVGLSTPSSSALAKTLEDADTTNYNSKGNAKVCMDRCMYDCTKAGGKTKDECTQSCRETCQTATGQLTSGTPDKEKGSETTK